MHRRSWVPTALVTAVAVAALAGCGTSTSQVVVPKKNQSRVIEPGDEYVAMGDSYTAAPYTGSTVRDDGCLQSSKNYPHQVAQALGLKLTDVSCGGAKTDAIQDPQKTPQGVEKPPQIKALTSKTALATLSIGGNDGGISSALGVTCLTLATAPTARPCTEADALAHKAGKGVEDAIAKMKVNLRSALQAIIVRAPNARIVVVGYPATLPSKTCAQFPIAAGDVAWAVRMDKAVVRAQKDAALSVGAQFVDMYDVSKAHDICSSDPWIAGEDPGADAAAGHPYPAEQAAVADAITGLLKK